MTQDDKETLEVLFWWLIGVPGILYFILTVFVGVNI